MLGEIYNNNNGMYLISFCWDLKINDILFGKMDFHW